MIQTPLSNKHMYVMYMTKHLREDLLDRMRTQAALRNTTIEDVLNIALAVGLPAVERTTAEQRRARATVQAGEK